MEKTCDNCKYREVKAEKSPCLVCITEKQYVYPHWVSEDDVGSGFTQEIAEALRCGKSVWCRCGNNPWIKMCKNDSMDVAFLMDAEWKLEKPVVIVDKEIPVWLGDISLFAIQNEKEANVFVNNRQTAIHCHSARLIIKVPV
jgi:hypothetical protein